MIRVVSRKEDNQDVTISLLLNDFFNRLDDSARCFPVPQVWCTALLAITFEDLANFVFHLINLYQLV